MARPNNPARDAAIAAGLASKTPPKDIAQAQGVSVSTVYRAAERFAVQPSKPAPAEQKAQPVVQVRRTLHAGDLKGRAHTGLKRQGGTVYDDYDYRFRTLNRRIGLYREMGDDPVAAAVMQACKMTLRRLSFYAESAGDTPADKQAVEFLDEAWDDMSQSGTDTIDQAANCLQYGFYPAEIVYKKRQGVAKGERAGSKYDDGKVGWRKWLFIAPESLHQGNEWVFGDDGGVQGLNQAGEFNKPIFIPIEKMVLFRTTTEKGNPEGRSLFRAMYKAWYFKSNLEEIEAISAERGGAGFPVVYLGEGTTRAGTSGDDLDLWKGLIRNIRLDDQMGLVIPHPKLDPATGRGVLFEFAQSPGGGTIDFGSPIVRHEQRMAMTGLAQFIHLGMQNVGAKSQNESSQDFFTLAVSAWADSIVDTINRYAVERLFAFNYFPGLTAIPRMAHEAVAQVDLPSIAEYINGLTGAQLITPSIELEKYLLELADLPITPKLPELWDEKEAKAKEQQEMAMKGQAVAIKTAQVGPLPKPSFSKNEADTDAEMLAELRLARQALELSTQAERFAAQPGGAQGGVTIENHIDRMVLPDNFTDAFKQPAPVVNVNIPKQPAPVVNVAPPVVNVASPKVYLPESFGQQPALTIPPASVTVHAELSMPDTVTETEIEHDKQTGRIKKTRATTKKVKK